MLAIFIIMFYDKNIKNIENKISKGAKPAIFLKTPAQHHSS